MYLHMGDISKLMPKLTFTEMLLHRTTLAAVVIALMGSSLTFMDSRHASATDVERLITVIYDDKRDRLEFEISLIESRIRRLIVIVPERRSAAQTQELAELKSTRERYLRTLLIDENSRHD